MIYVFLRKRQTMNRQKITIIALVFCAAALGLLMIKNPLLTATEIQTPEEAEPNEEITEPAKPDNEKETEAQPPASNNLDNANSAPPENKDSAAGQPVATGQVQEEDVFSLKEGAAVLPKTAKLP